jgi:SpoVK/Ycf46/Vps4 family AAA+-type ATPase
VHSKFNLPIRQPEEESSSTSANFVNSKAQNNNSNNNQEMPDIPNIQNIDKKLIDIIMSEVMDKTPPITWNDIAGLEFVKKTIQEIVIWPMLRP